MSFKFLDYNFENGVASFRYRGKDGIVFEEKIVFSVDGAVAYNEKALNSALFLAWILLGTSYYKAGPSRVVELEADLDVFQARFFDAVYQEGLGQFAFENNLTRDDLAHFSGYGEKRDAAVDTTVNDTKLVLVSGGKDSLLTAKMAEKSGVDFRVGYISSYEGAPEVVSVFGEPLVIKRVLDKERLKAAGGLNGHVPVTFINEALALIQAVLSGFDGVQPGLGREGVEPHAYIGDLAVNHQWSKTSLAQELLRKYVSRYITKSIKISSPLEEYSELEIAKMFAEECWDEFGDRFSSCNVINYRQDLKNPGLKWCGKCAKCANSYLLFAPYVDFAKQQKIFGRDLFTDPELTTIFKGLMGVDGVMKPFECVASVSELREAYRNRRPGYSELDFMK